ncbi:hypothetical protein EDD18DRAFT_1356819 [Armillaria luteobubalina]|uniref:Uncharacterized protein n=1 Tax=Armillaria luteobubalina TaxID=153913 RepID=A0AA39Q0I1_9AGAR|nr:hypothetical protein EDD18DRAFT_1356819 [Armillaria luteobubalina]
MLKATSFESLLYATHAALVVGTVWRVVHDQGRIRFIRCGLVIVMYLIATSPLALRWKFIQGITNDETQQYIYSHGWMLLSSTSFVVVILTTACIAIWWCWLFSGQRLMFAVIPGLCIIVGTSSAFFIVIIKQLELTPNLVFAGVGLHQMTVTLPSGIACEAQIDWMLPYISMILAVTLSCTLVSLFYIAMGPRIWGRTLRLWINVTIQSLLLFAAVPVAYILSDMHTACPLLGMTMIMSLAPILAIGQVPSNTVTPMVLPTHVELCRLGAQGNVGGTSREN